jgi:pimeloyl-ACP methyl ester carboxylesterase
VAVTPSPVDRACATHFVGSAGSLFGWYHPPSGPAVRATGIVLCPPFGVEYVLSHRTYRHLAERLGEAGFPTLRFDYHGTGDSAGDQRDPDRIRTWRLDILRATRELRSRSGLTEVGFVGLRLGATLALLEAAEQGDVASVVLWDPCLTGWAYVREMTYVAHFSSSQAPDTADCEACGFVLTAATQRELVSIDLRQLHRKPAPKALIIGTSRRGKERQLAETLQSLGVETTHRRLSGCSCIEMDPHEAAVPDQLLDATVAWLRASHPRLMTTPPPAQARRCGPTRIAEGLWEEAVHFGPEERLFGIVSSPRDGPTGTLPAIVLLNAGCIHRVGPHQLYVTMARHWARLGYVVLRCDLSGLGDSLPAPGRPENQMFPASAVADAAAAMSILGARYDAGRFVLVGLCSGAAVGFQAARVDQRVRGLVMLNPAELYFDHRAAHTYAVEDFEFRRYARCVVWRPPHSPRDLARGLSLTCAKVKRVAQRALSRALGAEPVDARVDFRNLSHRGVTIMLVYGEDDIGRDALPLQLGRDLGTLVSPDQGVWMEVLHSANHTFLPLATEKSLLLVVTAHLLARHPPGSGRIEALALSDARPPSQQLAA